MLSIEIFYSEEDNGYIAVVPELLGCSAFGETEEEALEEVKIAMELWLETAKKRRKGYSTTPWKRAPFHFLSSAPFWFRQNDRVKTKILVIF